MYFFSDFFKGIVHDELSNSKADTKKEHTDGDLCNFLIEEKTGYSEALKSQNESGFSRTRNDNKPNTDSDNK